jgi:hypothetical protein
MKKRNKVGVAISLMVTVCSLGLAQDGKRPNIPFVCAGSCIRSDCSIKDRQDSGKRPGRRFVLLYGKAKAA